MLKKLDHWFAQQFDVPVNNMFVQFGISSKVFDAFKKLKDRGIIIEVDHKVYRHVNNFPL
jgi:hypothetical protein